MRRELANQIANHCAACSRAALKRSTVPLASFSIEGYKLMRSGVLQNITQSVYIQKMHSRPLAFAEKRSPEWKGR